MTNFARLPLLIFDMDGTLIDSAKDVQFALNQMLKNNGRSTVDLPTTISHIGDGLHKLVHDFFPEFSIDSKEISRRVDEFLDIYKDEHLTSQTVLYPGVDEFLRTYQGPMAVVTNKNIHPTNRILEHFNLHQLNWVEVIGGDSLSERKPSPLALNLIMRKSGYRAEHTWMIGDGRPDMKAGEAARCKKVAVHYGYSKPEELEPFRPDHVLSSFRDLQLLIAQNPI